MDPDSSTPIIILLILLVLHAFFAAAKEAIVSTRKSRRLQLIEEGRRGAEQVDNLADDASRLLATEQLVLKFISFSIVAFSVLVYTIPEISLLFSQSVLASSSNEAYGLNFIIFLFLKNFPLTVSTSGEEARYTLVSH